ncbi:MAG: hypothetical protein D6800_15000 [Candidatus Zixiibacteriota bacterium]|nr:MAG: hypothetical protein D6800_15000 [candidate division Zixibacteria bacterium]
MKFVPLMFVGLMVCLLVGFVPTTGTAQCSDNCGNINGDVATTLDDMFLLLSHLLGDTAVADSLCADVDNRQGLTVADLIEYIIQLGGGNSWFHCNPTGQYSFAPTLTDTVILPATLSVPEHVNRVILNLDLRSASGGSYDHWFYLPLVGIGPTANDCFVLDAVDTAGSNWSAWVRYYGDTALVIAAPWNSDKETLLPLSYKRVTPGIGRIVPALAPSVLGRAMGVGRYCYPPDTCGEDMYLPVVLSQAGCCQGDRGNVDGDPSGVTDVADLTYLIDHLFITFPPLPCFDEADVNGDGAVDVADLTVLSDALFVSFNLPACPN